MSTGIVALAEIGDKTQLLSLLLATRYRRPWPIVWGILIATLLNHALAGLVGAWLTNLIGPDWMRWILGASFIAMGGWILIPDTLDDDEEDDPRFARLGVLGTTILLFFLAEMGDKTQVATVALAARFDSLMAVVAGTTFGMMLANAPVVFFGDRIARALPIRVIHVITAVLLAGMGVAILVGIE